MDFLNDSENADVTITLVTREKYIYSTYGNQPPPCICSEM